MILEVNNLEGGYGKKQVLYDISLCINEGEIVGLIGHNGAGKSTTLKCIFGLLVPSNGKVKYMNLDVTSESPMKNLTDGMYYVPQDNYLFNDLTVKDNLGMSFFQMKDQSNFEARVSEVFNYFPKLGERQNQLSGTLSGGERRMLGIGMGLLRNPKLLLLDEPSSGLSPVIFQNVVNIIQQINKERKTSILIVEQNVKSAFKISARIYVMKAGRILLEDTGENLLARKEWWDLF
jgi:branched-chain amino acid transport system ATP-binding protein